ncbi:hypothetical protein JD844_022241 [Phrynosoma platyrhinos]|uniref:Uncharacterized protein n=1 Tax=Phrynosoma platyrhinos TaxID=52577 RepID=A0ABQ7SV41_PHRPL|nr:hypothetical protein JD844_022241 [Phrynosoma platyrhinos]
MEKNREDKRNKDRKVKDSEKVNARMAEKRKKDQLATGKSSQMATKMRASVENVSEQLKEIFLATSDSEPDDLVPLVRQRMTAENQCKDASDATQKLAEAKSNEDQLTGLKVVESSAAEIDSMGASAPKFQTAICGHHLGKAASNMKGGAISERRASSQSGTTEQQLVEAFTKCACAKESAGKMKSDAHDPRKEVFLSSNPDLCLPQNFCCLEVPLGKQTVPMFEYEMKIKERRPFLITTISPQQQSLTIPPVKQHPPPFHGQPTGELHEKMNPGLAIALSSPGLKRHRSMWWNPKVSSVTLMLQRSLSLKSQSTLDNNRLWHLSQSRSQILPHREFKWKRFQTDRMLLKTASECHTKDRAPPSKIDQKHSSLAC